MTGSRAAAALGGGLVLAVMVYFTLVARLVDRASNTIATRPLTPVAAEAARVHATLEIADLHADTLLWPRDPLARARTGSTTSHSARTSTARRIPHTQLDVTGLPRLTEALLAEGFDVQEVGAIMGGNALRFLSRLLPRR